MNLLNNENYPRIEVYEYGLEGYSYDSYGYFGELRRRKNNNVENGIKVSEYPMEGMNRSVYLEYSKSLDPLIDATNGIYGELSKQPTKNKSGLRNFYKMYKNLRSRMKDRHFHLFNQFYNLPKQELILKTIVRAIKRQFNYLKNYYMKDIPENQLNNVNRMDMFKKNIFRFKDDESLKSITDYLHYGAFVYNIKLEDNEKVILFGDFHGSFHTFIRHLLRLHVLGVLDLSNGKYKINDGYRIVFLGDIVDRGNFGLEIIYILSKMMLENNTKDKLKLILNRGNHENVEMYSTMGFKAEYNYKLKNIQSLYLEKENLKINNKDFVIFCFFIYLSSGIVLQKNNYKYWCSHGGIPLTNIKMVNVKSQNGSENEYELFEMENIGSKEQYKNISQMRALDLNIALDNRIIFVNEDEENLPKQIRWNDFSNNLETTYNFSRGSNEIFNLGINHIKEFLELNNIQMIIRGHQDHYFNTWLLCNSQIAKLNKTFLTSHNHLFENNEECVYNLSKIPILPNLHPMVKHFLYEKNVEINNFLHKRPFESVPQPYKVYFDGAIAIVDASLNKWSTTTYEKRFNDNEIFYPVMTISTNTDNDRPFTKDSFVLLRFDGRANNNRRNINSLFRKELFIHNLNNVFIYNNSLIENQNNINNNENINKNSKKVEVNEVNEVNEVVTRTVNEPLVKRVPIKIIKNGKKGTNLFLNNVNSEHQTHFRPIKNENNGQSVIESSVVKPIVVEPIVIEPTVVKQVKEQKKVKKSKEKKPGYMKNTKSSTSRRR